jgi:2-keto-4-pentenoate hydratase/2-oxohepta-3-ene-1,7-dioic acid hydratase in catechol pathway
MKIVRYEKDWRGHWGIVEGDTAFTLEGDVFGDASPGDRVGNLDEITLLAPCQPQTIWSNGANYPSRCYERDFPLPTEPSFLWSPGSMICGPDAEIRIPEFEPRSEYGAELGVVLRRDCYQVEEAEADEYIFGYTILNNVWIKDTDQVAYERPLRVYDNHCPVGPIVDTEAGWRDRRVRLSVDGQVRQDDNTSSMMFSPQFLISYLSKLVPMKKGDLIMTGTPGGVEGHVLHYGESVEIEIDGLGILRNQVTRIDTGAVTYIIGIKKWIASAAGQAYVQTAVAAPTGGR